LKQVLEVRDSQSGFAGISGTVWRIEPDGRYVGARFANQIEGPPVLSGKLDPQTLARLAELLRSDAWQSLPAHLGEGDPVNVRTLSISQGARTVTLELPPPDPTTPERLLPRSSSESDSLKVFQVLRDALGAP
jgi:hypothetical protein